MNLPKAKLDLAPYDERADNIFPSVILTLISIIQGVSFYVLMDNTFKLILAGEPIAPILPYCFLSLTNLVLVAFEYIYGLLDYLQEQFPFSIYLSYFV